MAGVAERVPEGFAFFLGDVGFLTAGHDRTLALAIEFPDIAGFAEEQGNFCRLGARGQQVIFEQTGHAGDGSQGFPDGHTAAVGDVVLGAERVRAGPEEIEVLHVLAPFEHGALEEILGGVTGPVRHAVIHHRLVVVARAFAQVGGLEIDDEPRAFGLAVGVVLGPREGHGVVLEGLDERGLVHPVEGVHAAHVGRGVDVGAQLLADGGGLVGERGDALGGAEFRAVPVEPLELRETGGVVFLFLGQHADLDGDISGHGGERLHVIPTGEAEVRGGFAALFQILAEGLDLGGVFHVHGGQADFVAVGDIVKLVVHAAFAHPLDDDGGVLRVVVGQRALDDGAARLGEFEHLGNGLRVGVGRQGVQADGFAEGEFDRQVGVARADGTGAGEEAELLGNRPESGDGVQIARHGAIHVAEFERGRDAFGAMQIRLDEQRERLFPGTEFEGFDDLRRAGTGRDVHRERLAETGGLAGGAGFHVGSQRAEGIGRAALGVHRGAEVVPRRGFAGRDGRGPVAGLAAVEGLARRVVEFHQLTVLRDVVVVGPVAPVVPDDLDGRGGGLGIAEAEINVVGAAQLVEERVARELRRGERREVGGEEDGVDGAVAAGFGIFGFGEGDAVAAFLQLRLVTFGGVVVEAPVPVEIAGGELGGEAIMLGRLAEAVGVLEDGRAAGNGRDAEGEGVVEEGRAFVFGPDLVSRGDGDFDFGGDFGGRVGGVGHGIAEAAGPDAAEDHVLVEVVAPAADLPARGGTELVLRHALHVFGFDDDAGGFGGGDGGRDGGVGEEGEEQECGEREDAAVGGGFHGRRRGRWRARAVGLFGLFADGDFRLVLSEKDERKEAGSLAGFAGEKLDWRVAGRGGFFEREREERFLGFAEDDEFELVRGVAARGDHEELRLGGRFTGADFHAAKITVRQRGAGFHRREVPQPQVPEWHGILAGLGKLVGGGAFVGDDEGADFARADRRRFVEIEFAGEREAGEVLGGFGENLGVFLGVGQRDGFLRGRQRGSEEQGEAEGGVFHGEFAGG